MDVQTLSFAVDGKVWVGTAAGVSTIAADLTVSNLDLISGSGANPAARSIQTGWSVARELASSGGSNRDPALSIDETNRTWLLWSQQNVAGNDSWTLHSRIRDPAAMTWSADMTLTAPLSGNRSSDRMPSAIRLPGGMRVYFASDRNGGTGLWSVDVELAGVVGPLKSIIDHPSADLAPTPIAVGGALWLVYRSDRNVPIAQMGASPAAAGGAYSRLVPDNGTLRRFTGSLAADPGDLTRIRTGKTFGDLLCYTPNRPDGVGRLADDELYTRGTVGFYVGTSKDSIPLTQQEVARLREFLARFIPANLRAVVITVTVADSETVYGGADIQERYQDSYPFSDSLGDILEAFRATIPGLAIIKSNLTDSVSANPANPATFQRRTWFPPLQ
jgi:hypothetical protein